MSDFLALQELTAADLNAHTGPVWSTYTPVWTATTTNPVLGNGTIAGAFVETGHILHFWIELVMGSTTTFGSGNYQLTLPATKPLRSGVATALIIDNGSAVAYSCAGRYTAGGDIFRMHTGAGATVTAVAPFTFAQNDGILVTGTYET